MVYLLFFVTVSVLLEPFVFANDDVLVHLPDGTIRGKQSETKGAKLIYYSFLKVPYAAPPIGNLRFKAPVPPKKWNGILDTTSNRVICYQVNRDLDIESEDCLYLNIYTPKLPKNTDKNLIPVIFYIHGGGFIQGTCISTICGPEFLLENGVIVVTINYRLGPFGFLSTQDKIISGNNGLKDQHLGIKWVYDNIRLFGGDPLKITIMGQSAGAASVTYQLLNIKSQGLFWGAIAQSGTFLSPWSFQRNARKIAFKTASFIDNKFNNSNSSDELLEFLQKVSAKELDAASRKMNELENLKNRQINQGYFYAPVIEPDHEEAFITRKMYNDLAIGNFVKTPIMIGITSEESIEDAIDLSILKNNMKLYDENLDWLVPDDLAVEDFEKKKMIGNVIRAFYTSGNFEDDLSAGIRYFSDTSFTRSVIKHAELHSKFESVYFYQFSYDGMIGNISANLTGAERVAHSEDLRYILGIIFEGYDNTNIEVFPRNDILIHQRMLRLWTNFAKTLTPTLENDILLQNISWVPFKSTEFSYLDINHDLKLKKFPKSGSYLPWNFLYSLYHNATFDTY